MLRRFSFLAAVVALAATLPAVPGRADPPTPEHFPLGLYHVGFGVASDPNDDVGGAQLIADLEAIAAAGFDTINAMPDTPDLIPFLERAEELGVKVILSKDGTPDDWEDILPDIRDMPALYGIVHSDDVNSRGPDRKLRYPVKQAKADYALRKSQAPNQHVYMSGGGDTAYAGLGQWAPAADIIGAQQYPVCNYSDSYALIAMYKAMRKQYVGLVKNKQQTWYVNGQTFAWNEDCRVPTEGEYRNMMWAALANGADGILNYTYFDGGGYLPVEHPQFWNQIQVFNQDVRAIEDFLLNGQFTTVPAAGSLIHGAYWIQGSEMLVVLYNTHASVNRTAKLKLPLGTTGALQPVFGHYPSGLTNNNGVITGTMAPGSTHVYKIQL